MVRRSVASSPPPRTLPAWLLTPWLYGIFGTLLGSVVAFAVMGRIPGRWTKALMGGIFLALVLMLPSYAIVGLFLMIYNFPTAIYIGNTNVIFVLFMVVIWVARVRLGREPAPVRTHIEWAVGCYVGAHIISFLNVDTPANVVNGIFQMEFYAAAIAIAFLIANSVHDERQLRFVLHAFAFGSLLVFLTGVLEFFRPNYQLIPEGFIASGPTGKRFAEGGRVGGVFGFHGLLADFSAMTFILHVYLFIRSRNILVRIYYTGLMAMAVFLIFVTANRGGFIVWVIGLAYMLWIGRGGITLRRIVISLPALLGTAAVLLLLVRRYGRMIILLWRLGGTTLQGGVPETRAEVWARVLKEIPEHLWIGHGPFYDLQGGMVVGRAWPHSAYLMYLWTTGIVGLVVFLWILFKLIARSYPGGRLRLGSVPYAQGALAVAHIQIIQFALAQTRDEHQRGNVAVYLMWAVFGLAIASRRIWKTPAGVQPDPSAGRSSDGSVLLPSERPSG